MHLCICNYRILKQSFTLLLCFPRLGNKRWKYKDVVFNVFSVRARRGWSEIDSLLSVVGGTKTPQTSGTQSHFLENKLVLVFQLLQLPSKILDCSARQFQSNLCSTSECNISCLHFWTYFEYNMNHFILLFLSPRPSLFVLHQTSISNSIQIEFSNKVYCVPPPSLYTEQI